MEKHLKEKTPKHTCKIESLCCNLKVTQHCKLPILQLKKSRELFFSYLPRIIGLPRWLSAKETACQWRRYRFDPWVEKNPWRMK